MKQLCITFLMLLLSCCNILASTEERTPNEYLFYDINSSAPFVYNNTINMRGNINHFNIPFAYDVVVDGNHLDFSISNEDFKWFVVRKLETNYWDIEVNFYDGTHLGWPGETIFPIATVYIIRVMFNR